MSCLGESGAFNHKIEWGENRSSGSEDALAPSSGAPANMLLGRASESIAEHTTRLFENTRKKYSSITRYTCQRQSYAGPLRVFTEPLNPKPWTLNPKSSSFQKLTRRMGWLKLLHRWNWIWKCDHWSRCTWKSHNRSGWLALFTTCWRRLPAAACLPTREQSFFF